MFAVCMAGVGFGGTVLTDADWLGVTPHAEVTSIVDLPGDPGVGIEITKFDDAGVAVLQVYFGGVDLSANGDTFVLELENPTGTGFNINAFAQSGGWQWTQHWEWLGAGQTKVYTVTMTDPTSVDQLGFQLHAGPGDYAINIRGGVLDFSPSEPNPADGGSAGVLKTGNLITWVNHSSAFPATGDDVTADLYIGTDPNDLLTNPATTVISGVGNSATVDLVPGRTYYWIVQAFEPDGGGGTIMHESPLWQFDAVGRLPMTHYEAEDATIEPGDDSAPELRNDATASGGKLIWSNWSGTSRGGFSWYVMAPEAGDYEMTIHYKIGGTAERGEKLQINDGPLIGDIMFPGTNGEYSDHVLPITLQKGPNLIRIVGSWGGISYDYFEIDMDDLTATHQNPGTDEVVLVNDNNTLNWRKYSLSDPVNASDVVCNVYLGTTEPNMVNDDPNELYFDYDLTAVAIDTDQTTVDVTLEWGQNYYWIVDSIVPVEGVDTLFGGFVWTFTTEDPPPVIELDVTKVVKRTEAVNMEPVVADLGKPGIGYAWTLDEAPGAVTIEDVCSDTTALDPEFVFDVVGLYFLTLTVTDESDNVVTATIEVTVIEYFRSLRIEAEEGTIFAGDTSPELRYDAEVSDNRLVWSTWYGSNRGALEISVDAPAAGAYDMIIRYAVGGTGARGDKMSINGGPISSDIMYPGTDDMFTDYLMEGVQLNEGANTIRFVTSWGGISYDYIEFPAIEAPKAPYGPGPENWENIPSNYSGQLSWVFDANSLNSVIDSDVYFSTTEPNFAQADYGMMKFAAVSGTTATIPVELEDDTTYYWLVETTDSEAPGEVFRSKVWLFNVLEPCLFHAATGDLDLDCDVDFGDLQIFAENWMVPETGYIFADFVDLADNWMVCIDPVTGEPGNCQ